jgi:hypothetical protein
MRVFKRNAATGGFNISAKGGAVKPQYRMKSEGLGKADTEDFYEKIDSKDTLKTLTPHRLRSLDSVKLKSSRPKKYISLNL